MRISDWSSDVCSSDLTTSMNTCAHSITTRRSKLSANAPAHNDSSMIGSVVEDCTRATSCGESTSDAIIQDAPTDWMRPPKFEAMLAIQTARKVDICSGDGVKFPANSGEVLVIQLRCGTRAQLGRASCRERVCQYVSISVVAVSRKNKTQT